MTQPDAQLLAALVDGAPHMPASVSTLSDADALTALNTAYTVPRDYRITWTSLGDILGGSTAIALTADLQTMQAAGGATGASATYAMGVLGGTGLDPTNATAQAMVQQFVAGSVLTPQQATTLLNYTYYPAGWLRTVDEVTNARAWMGRQAAVASLRASVQGVSDRLPGVIDAAAAGDGDLPTAAAVVQAAMTAAGVA